MRFIVVSNREPYVHAMHQGRVECITPASGMATALDPIMRASGGVWIAHGSGDADRLVTDALDHVAVPPDNPRYTLRRVWLDKEIEKGYYYGLSNEGLWPLCHIAFHSPVFRLGDWECYRRANQIFADAVLEEAQGEPAFVFIQDYHFGLLPRMLKNSNPSLVVAQFWHIPVAEPGGVPRVSVVGGTSGRHARQRSAGFPPELPLRQFPGDGGTGDRSAGGGRAFRHHAGRPRHDGASISHQHRLRRALRGSGECRGRPRDGGLDKAKSATARNLSASASIASTIRRESRTGSTAWIFFLSRIRSSKAVWSLSRWAFRAG